MFARLEPLLLVPVAFAAAGVASSAMSANAASAATAGSAGGAVFGGALKAKFIAAIVSAGVIGAIFGAAGYASVASPPPLPAISPPNTAPVRAPEPIELGPEPVLTPLPAPSAGAALPSAATRSTRLAGSLRAERLLIETASAALMRGDPRSAILALRQHAQRFPRGDLAEEREVLLVKALAASGDSTAAEKRADDFKKKFPDSMQQGSVNDAARSP
jgi:TolA-binding protein